MPQAPATNATTTYAAIEVLSAPVVDGRCARVSVASSELHVPQRYTDIQRSHDERATKHVRVNVPETGAFADRSDPPMRGAPIKPGAVTTHQDWPITAFPDSQVNRPRSPRDERNHCWFVALTGDPQGPVTTVKAKIIDVGVACLRSAQNRNRRAFCISRTPMCSGLLLSRKHRRVVRDSIAGGTALAFPVQQAQGDQTVQQIPTAEVREQFQLHRRQQHLTGQTRNDLQNVRRIELIKVPSLCFGPAFSPWREHMSRKRRANRGGSRSSFTIGLTLSRIFAVMAREYWASRFRAASVRWSARLEVRDRSGLPPKPSRHVCWASSAVLA